MGIELAHNREALEAALAGHVTVTATLADIDFTAFDTPELLALQSEREQHARTQAMIDHRIQSALMARATPHEIGGKSWTDVLATRMRISRKEASRRVAAAENLGPRYSLTGEVLAPALPACADALRSGSINTEHITIIRATVEKAETTSAQPNSHRSNLIWSPRRPATPPKHSKPPPTSCCICSTRTATAPTSRPTCAGCGSANKTPTGWCMCRAGWTPRPLPT